MKILYKTRASKTVKDAGKMRFEGKDYGSFDADIITLSSTFSFIVRE